MADSGEERSAMRWLLRLASCAALAVALAACGGGGGSGDGSDDPTPTPTPPQEVDVRELLAVPDHMQLPAIPDFNPISAEKIALGRHLFYDKRLSGNQSQSCASCHQQELAFTDGRRTSVGSTGQTLVRNSQGLANVAYHSTLTWASNNLLELEDQIEVPIRNDNPIELGVTDSLQDEVLARFDADPEYVRMFADAFPESSSGATINKIIFALASFCRAMISGGSAFDDYLAGDDEALTPQQRQGFGLFNGERFECFHCHQGILLSTAYRDENTTPGTIRFPFFNNGLYNVGNDGSYPPHDQGLYELTLDPLDRGLFRPANLRNVAVTAPYMHDGSIPTLRDVLKHYAAGGRVIESGPFAGDGRLNPHKSGLVRGFQATDEEIDAVVAFLESLTDYEFIENAALSDPFATPALGTPTPTPTFLPTAEPTATPVNVATTTPTEQPQDHREIAVGSSAAGGGALATEFDYEEPIVLTFSSCIGGTAPNCTGGTSLYTATSPGFDGGVDGTGLYALDPETPVTIEIVAIDEGLSLRVEGERLDSAGQSILLGVGPDLHSDAETILALPGGTDANDLRLVFRLTTTAAAYQASADYELRFTTR